MSRLFLLYFATRVRVCVHACVWVVYTEYSAYRNALPDLTCRRLCSHKNHIIPRVGLYVHINTLQNLTRNNDVHINR